MALLKTRESINYCSNCMMQVHQIEPYCRFCGEEFYNYEEFIIERSIENEENRIHTTSNKYNVNSTSTS